MIAESSWQRHRIFLIKAPADGKTRREHEQIVLKQLNRCLISTLVNNREVLFAPPLPISTYTTCRRQCCGVCSLAGCCRLVQVRCGCTEELEHKRRDNLHPIQLQLLCLAGRLCGGDNPERGTCEWDRLLSVRILQNTTQLNRESSFRAWDCLGG